MKQLPEIVETIAWMLVGVGGFLLAAALLLMAAAIVTWAGNRLWTKCRAIYLLDRMHWALADLQKHGKVLPRPDMKIGIDDET